MAFGTPLVNSNRSIAIYKETAFNTCAAGPKAHILPWVTGSIGVKRAKGSSKILRSDPNPTKFQRGYFSGGESFTVGVGPKSICLLAYLFFSEYSKSGAGDPYSHVFKMGSTAARYAAFEDGNTKYDVSYGNVITGMEFPLKPEASEMLCNVTVMGSGKNLQQQAARIDAGTPTTYWDDEFMSASSSILSIDSTAAAWVLDGSIKLERECEMVVGKDGNLYAAYAFPAKYKVTGNITALMDTNDTARTLATGLAEHAFQLFNSFSANHDMTLNIDEAQCEISQIPPYNDGGKQTIQIDIDGYLENDADASAARLTVRNATADIAAIW